MLNSLRHILRKQDCKTALGWQQEGKRKEEDQEPHGGGKRKRKETWMDGPAGIQRKTDNDNTTALWVFWRGKHHLIHEKLN